MFQLEVVSSQRRLPFFLPILKDNEVVSLRAKFVLLNVSAWILEIAAFGLLVRSQSQSSVYAFFILLAVAFGLAIASLFLSTQKVRAGTAGEALIPYSIVLALCCILAPVFPTQRRPTRTACLSYTKQIVTAHMIYSSDHDDRTPPALSWRDLVQPYTKQDAKIFKCPDAEAPYSQAMNVSMSMIDLATLDNAVKVVLIFECSSQEPNAIGTERSFVRRHNERGTVGRADGSAKAIRNDPGEAIWQPNTQGPKP